jgi:hypothetical protein
MKASTFLAKIFVLLIFSSMANSSQLYSYQEGGILCMATIEHADAEKLADTLAPFLSSQEKISAYSLTNTLIIRDNPTVVRIIIKVIKGKEDLSECQNFNDIPKVNEKNDQ